MEYLEYTSKLIIDKYTYLSNINFWELFWTPDLSTATGILNALDSKSESIVISYLEREDIIRILWNSKDKLRKYLAIYYPILPSLREANIKGWTYLFKYLHQEGIMATEYEMVIATINGNLGILKYLVESDIIPQHYLIDEAVQAGHLEIVKYLVKIGILPITYTRELAETYKHREILEYFGTLEL